MLRFLEKESPSVVVFNLSKKDHAIDECGHSLILRNIDVAVKRWIEILLPLIIIITASLRVNRYIYISVTDAIHPK